MASVLVIDESQQRAVEICTGLIQAGHQVAAVLPSALELVARIEGIKPDIILIETESPSRDTLEHLGVMGRDMPRPAVDVAVAHFEEHLALKRELAETSRKLSERKVIEKAKGILMKSRGMDEETAYGALGKLPMERSQPLAKVAGNVVDMAELLL